MDLSLNFTLPNPLSTESHIFDFNLRTLLSEFWGTRRRGLLKTKIRKITQASSFKFTVDVCLLDRLHEHSSEHHIWNMCMSDNTPPPRRQWELMI